jgi:hypothetical protein
MASFKDNIKGIQPYGMHKETRLLLSKLYNEEDCMLEVTATATEQISEFFKEKDASPIRIFLNEGG